MIAFVTFSALLALASSQFNQPSTDYQPGFPQQAQTFSRNPSQYQQQPQAYQSQAYQPQQAQAYQPQQAQPQPQAYQPQSRPQSRNPQPAAVHYVNIGADLAGDYKFGYDTGKDAGGQSFREETRMPDGSVKGAYGYVDDSGKQRIVRYTAGKDGYKVEGDDVPKQPVSAPHADQSGQRYNNNDYNRANDYNNGNDYNSGNDYNGNNYNGNGNNQGPRYGAGNY